MSARRLSDERPTPSNAGKLKRFASLSPRLSQPKRNEVLTVLWRLVPCVYTAPISRRSKDRNLNVQRAAVRFPSSRRNFRHP